MNNRFVAIEKSVGGVVFRKQAGVVLYLLLRYRSWQWDFPKGHPEGNENEEQTLRRELFEETKLVDISIMPNFRRSVYYFYRAKGNEKKERLNLGRGVNIFKKVVFYCVQTGSSEIEIDFENKDFVWLTFEQAIARLGNDDSKKILTLANDFILTKKS